MTYVSPDALMREWHESNNAAQHELCKARVMVDNALRSVEAGKVKGAAASLEHAVRRLDKAQGKLHPAHLTQWRQAKLVPRVLRRQRSVGAPADFVCKKCGEQRAPEDFRWNDGKQAGYTKRCRFCRRSGRKAGLAPVQPNAGSSTANPSPYPESDVGGAAQGGDE